MSIISGRGDLGETDLMFSKRIAKTSLRVEALGSVDELNAALGLARAAEDQADVVTIIDGIQSRLVGLMGQLATLPEDEERYLEKKLRLPLLGGSRMGHRHRPRIRKTRRPLHRLGKARRGRFPGPRGLDYSRAVARRAERSVLALHESGEPVPEVVRLFFNRLSDLLWILARVGGG